MNRPRKMAIAAVVLLLAAAMPCALCSGKRVLALIGSEDIRSSHSQYFQGLRDAGLEVDVRGHKDSGLKLADYDTPRYDHLLLLAPRATSFGGSLSKASILEWADAGGNLLVALAPGASDLVRGLAADLGVEVDAKGTRLYDHFSRQAAGGATDPSLVATSAWIDSDAFLGAARPSSPVLFRGVAQAVPTSSELVTVLLSGEATSYSHDPTKAAAEPPLLPAGGAAALVSAVQSRNNARALVVGSLDLLGDELFDAAVEVAESGKSYPQSGNRAFALAATLWAFQQRGVLEASAPRHRNVVTGEEGPSPYRVKDEVQFEIDIFEVEGGERRPFKSDDVQVSFVMLDPYIRQPLQHAGDGKFSLRFTVPDVYGVFKYAIDYHHAGYSYINLEHVVPVRPYRHDEYERFILAAYPYYASAASTMAAFLVLGLAFLYGK
ncbi:oligosaccharyltransferase complex subunit beta [Monoraphidium neglectum]|uniref:Dolichyl-diphosphooligosaccharide--protein glycosyltransferase 48 kDa subunit n=1 Tax=Monoraphidium neglectum TaxID=145388 RepID=A0A0D2NUQ7_9CHLO|nr:oligosaccharyltransferase complex subunit beta [Monoraphidium neglectum]KIZ07826.1 oligosaccharyltransferase complex subunit beta [Monoraphidium neglectum]|eukprot:XP_013906845.1 oligosaccharyltransferase complex subunit beta [Monoraphidium neglectum]